MKRVTLLVLCLLLALTACGEKEEIVESPSPSPTQTARPSPIPSPSPSPEPLFYNPLTGLAADDEASSLRRPAAIMINNLRMALPQHGIGKADIIFEMVAEGGITRLVMLTQSPENIGVIGSVRSTRSYYLDIAQSFDAVLFHAGASEMAYADIAKRKVNNADGTRGGAGIPALYYRDRERAKTRAFEHCLMTSGELIYEYMQNMSYRVTLDDAFKAPLCFEPDYTPDGGKADTIRVKFSNYKTAVFQYADSDERYYVEQYDAPHTDHNDDSQISFDNLLVIYTGIRPIRGDAYDRMEADMVGSGGGVYYAGGGCEEIRWSRSAHDAPYVFTNAEGDALTLRAGTSYICIVPSEANVTQTAPSEL